MRPPRVFEASLEQRNFDLPAAHQAAFGQHAGAVVRVDSKGAIAYFCGKLAMSTPANPPVT